MRKIFSDRLQVFQILAMEIWLKLDCIPTRRAQGRYQALPIAFETWRLTEGPEAKLTTTRTLNWGKVPHSLCPAVQGLNLKTECRSPH